MSDSPGLTYDEADDVLTSMVEALRDIGGDHYFNQYEQSDTGEVNDAPFLRLQNLRTYLQHGCGKGGAFILNSAAGPLDAKATGIPRLTEFQMLNEQMPVYGSQVTIHGPDQYPELENFWRELWEWRHSVVVWDWCPLVPSPEVPEEALIGENPSLYFQPLSKLLEIVNPIRFYYIGDAAGRILEHDGYQAHALPDPVENSSQFAKAIDVEVGGMVRKWSS